MKLLNKILFQISPLLLIVMTLWASWFYTVIISEVNDEVDDSLEAASEQIIIRTLAGEDVSQVNQGTNNQYYIHEVTDDYASENKHRRFIDSMVYIKSKKETEPARILKTYFKDDDDRMLELVVSTPTIEKADLQTAILKWVLILYFSLLIIIILINVWMFKQNLSPLYVLLKWLDKYKIGGHNAPLENQTDVVEFQKLNNAALRNAQRAETLFEQQKLFIGNASHEIQTPLAICKNRLEMMMEDPNITEQQLEELIKVHKTLGSITKLNKSLLLLSKIDNGQFIEVNLIRMNTLIERYLADFREAYAYKNIDVTYTVHGNFVLEINESLAVILVTNLLKNAFVHNVDNGKIHIDVYFDSFTVANTGDDEALDPERIFERFYHTRKREGSTGLGLALVESICKLYELKCNYKFVDGLHQFSLES
ncbi:MAG: sensor histidine kinase [Tannerellaceae bacterium]